ncbi:hypothetical protein ScPMuIL_007999 [Solemya velum]
MGSASIHVPDRGNATGTHNASDLATPIDKENSDRAPLIALVPTSDTFKDNGNPLSSQQQQAILLNDIAALCGGLGMKKGWMIIILCLHIIAVHLASSQCTPGTGPQEISASDQWGTFATPNYDTTGFLESVECDWVIRNPLGSVGVILYETAIGAGEQISVKIYEGDTIDPASIVPVDIVASGGPTKIIKSSAAIRINVKTGMLGSPVGFKVRFATVPNELPVCGQPTDDPLIAREEPGFLYSPNFPAAYNPKEACIWTFVSETGDMIDFQLMFLDLDPDESTGVCSDILQINDDIGELAELCNPATLDVTYISRTPSAEVMFSSDQNFLEGSGFQIRYWSVPATTETTTVTTMDPSTTVPTDLSDTKDLIGRCRHIKSDFPNSHHTSPHEQYHHLSMVLERNVTEISLHLRS